MKNWKVWRQKGFFETEIEWKQREDDGTKLGTQKKLNYKGIGQNVKFNRLVIVVLCVLTIK